MMLFVSSFLVVEMFFDIIKRSVTSRLHRTLSSPGISEGSVLLKYHYPLCLSSPSADSNSASPKVSFDRSPHLRILAHLLGLACSLITN